ncbi:hypothetical protein CIHG_10072 [Coccidioides immitis H538.4]|uniref:Uncharacterized protein n=3 Tax=Coccidioides immitis TaxID=5501 RepID=A0A0J8R8M0_COCIT|nr:hypothetical protein CIRG_05166 [Coccidioides immitis RMSCC 2394]KMU81374.1 hypothetical protein CISG_09062 [Coccidioides immitis RMSCC 3703]KMU92226.1 hypothetical protein CIHG_10072 [Coccidioides immitis H538.4]
MVVCQCTCLVPSTKSKNPVLIFSSMRRNTFKQQTAFSALMSGLSANGPCIAHIKMLDFLKPRAIPSGNTRFQLDRIPSTSQKSKKLLKNELGELVKLPTIWNLKFSNDISYPTSSAFLYNLSSNHSDRFRGIVRAVLGTQVQSPPQLGCPMDGNAAHHPQSAGI